MENKKHSLTYSSMTYGLYLGLALVVYYLVLYVANQFFNPGLGYVVYLIIAGGLFFSMKHFRDKLNAGVLTYGNGVKLGVLVAVFSGFISGVFTYVLFIIDPTLIDQMIQVQQQALIESGVPDSQIELVEEMMRKRSNLAVIVISSLFSMALVGLLISLIVAAIVKKNPDNGFAEAVKEVE